MHEPASWEGPDFGPLPADRKRRLKESTGHRSVPSAEAFSELPPGAMEATSQPQLAQVNVSSLSCLDSSMPSALPSLHLGPESESGDVIQAYAELVFAFWAAHRRAV